MTTASTTRRRPGNEEKGCSWSWRSKICAAPLTCSGPHTTLPMESMVGSRWSCRRCWPTTRHTALRRRPGFTGRPTGATCSSRFRVRRKVFRRSRNRSSLACPINVTLLFSREQYVAAAEAYLRGIERRLAAGLNPRVASVASLFVSRWDKAVSDTVPADLRNRLGIAIAARTYQAYRELLASPRWRTLAAAGARPQRLLWASTGTKDPKASETLYVEALAAPDTINTIPEKTLHAFAEHGELKGAMAEDGGDAEAVLARFTRAGIDVDALATQLQRDGAKTFVKSWQELLQRIDDKSAVLAGAGQRTG